MNREQRDVEFMFVTLSYYSFHLPCFVNFASTLSLCEAMYELNMTAILFYFISQCNFFLSTFFPRSSSVRSSTDCAITVQRTSMSDKYPLYTGEAALKAN